MSLSSLRRSEELTAAILLQEASYAASQLWEEIFDEDDVEVLIYIC
jgi:hypothetical protein